MSIYHGLVYEGRAHSILECADQAFVLNGFSKLFAMTGWRLGYVIAPPSFVRPMQKIQQNLFISAGAFVQRAGHRSAATGTARRPTHGRDADNERRRVMLAGLRNIGFGVSSTSQTGAFYIFADATRFGRESYAVGLRHPRTRQGRRRPGIDFGANGEGYLRFSYANSLDHIHEGLRRLNSISGMADTYP